MPETPKKSASILVAGFGPARGFRSSATGELLADIVADPPENSACRALLLPPGPDDALLKAVETMDHFLPDAVLVLGFASGAGVLSVERVARNAVDSEQRDPVGRPGKVTPIDAAGPAGYFSTLPVQAMVDRMSAGGVPSRISTTGETLACNRIYYALLHYVSLRGRETWFNRQPPAGLMSRIGLISIPPTPEMNALAGRTGPSLALETSQRGLRLAIGAIVEHLAFPAEKSASPHPVRD